MNQRISFYASILIAVGAVFGQAQAPAAKAADSPAGICVLAAPGVEASATGAVKNEWLSAILEAYYAQRFQPIKDIGVVDPDSVHKKMPELDDYAKPYTDRKLLEVAKLLKATHIFSHKYEIDATGTTISYYAEIITVSTGNVLTTCEKDISLDRLDEGLGDCVSQFLAKVNYTPGAETTKLLKMPLLGSDVNALKNLGNAMARSVKADKGNWGKIAAGYLRSADREGRLALAYIKAGEAFNAAGDLGQAATAYDHVIVQNGIAYPQLFIEASRAYRLTKQLDAAQRIITLADRLGVKDAELLAENARILEEQGNTAEAQKVYVKIFAADPNQPDALLFMARQSNAKKDYQKANDFADKLIAAGKQVGFAWLEKGKALAGAGKMDEALKAFQTATKIMGDDPELQRNLGDAFRSQKMYTQAAAAYEKALKGNPNDEGLLLAASDCYTQANTPANALALLTQNVSRFYMSKVVPKEMGLLEFQLKDTTNARKHLESYLGTEPKDGRVFLTLGKIYTASGENSKAIQMLDQAMSMVDDKNSVHIALAKLYLITKEPVKAEPHLTAILASKPDYPQANKMLGDVMRAAGKTAAALACYKKERAVTGDEKELLLALSQCEFETGDLTTAFTDFKRLSQLDPTNAAAAFSLALISLKQNKIQQAQEYLVQAEVLGKADKTIYQTFGDAYRAQKMFPQAATAYEKALKDNPDNESLLLSAAECHTASGNPQKASALLQLNLSKFPSSKVVPRELGLLEFQLKDTADARKHLELCSGTDQKDGRVFVALGKIYTASGENGKAIQMFEQALPLTEDKNSVRAPLAKLYLLQKSTGKAEPLLNAILASKPEYPQVNKLLGDVQRSAGKTAAALACYKKERTITGDEKELVQSIAQCEYETGDFTTAFIDYKRLLQMDPTNAAAAYRLALISLRQTKIQQAQEYLTQAEVLGKPDKTIYPTFGEAYRGQKMFPQAAAAFEKGLKDNPTDESLLLKASDCYMSANSPQKAAAVLTQNISKFPTSKTIPKELGLLEFQLKDTADARKHLEAYLGTEPKDGRVFLYLGKIYASAKEYDKGIQMLDQAMPLIEDKNSVRAPLAKLYILTKEPARAEPLLNAILAAKPEYPQANRMLGDVMRGQGKTASALICYKKERTISGDDKELVQAIAQCEFETGDFTTAYTDYRRLVQLDPTNAAAFFNLSIISLKQNKIQQAQEYLTQAEVLGKADKAIYRDIGRGLAAAGAYEKAVTAYKTCLSALGNDPAVWIELGDIYAKMKKDGDAAAAYLKAFDLDPVKYKDYAAQAGHIYYRLGSKKEASSAYDKYINKGYMTTEVNVNAATLEFGDKNYAKVIQLLKPVTGAAAQDEKVVSMLATSYGATGDAPNATKYSEILLTKDPNNKVAIEALALTYEKSGDLKRAVTMYKKFLALPKTDKHQEYAYHCGELYEKIGQTDFAIAQYQSNADTYAGDIRNYVRLADLYRSTNALTNASKILSIAVTMQAAPNSMFRDLAEVYKAMGKADLAAPMYEQYLKKAPNDTAWYSLANIYYAQGNYRKSILPLKKSMELMPSNDDCQLKLAQAYLKSDSIAQAIIPLTKFINLNPNDKKVLEMLTQCYRAQKDTANLITTLRKREPLEQGQDKADLDREVGNLLLAKGSSDQAIVAYENASAAAPMDIKLHKLLADMYEKKNDKKARLDHLDAALGIAPNDPDLNFDRARYCMDTNDPLGAERSLAKTIDLNPRHVQAHAMYGKILEGRKNYTGALEQYTAASANAPANMQYVLDMANMQFQTGDTASALKTAQKALAFEPKNVKAIEWTGYYLKITGQDPKAEPLLAKGAQLDKACPFCNDMLGDIYYAKGDFTKAISSYEGAARQSGQNDKAMTKLANILMLKGKFGEAEALYERAFAINPQNEEAMYRLCAVNIDQGLFDKASAILKKNEGQHRQSGWYHLVLARLEEAKGNVDAAAISYSVALRLTPDNSQAYLGLGRVYIAQNRTNEAMECFGKASINDPSNPEILIGMARVSITQKDFSTAIDLLQDVVNRQPDNPDVYYLLGMSYGKRGDHTKAIDAINTGMKIDPKNTKLYMALGHEYRVTKQYNQAIEQYQKAIKMDKEEGVEGYMYIGDIYFAGLRDNKNAEKFYEKYIEAGGQNPKAKGLLQKLKK